LVLRWECSQASSIRYEFLNRTGQTLFCATGNIEFKGKLSVSFSGALPAGWIKESYAYGTDGYVVMRIIYSPHGVKFLNESENRTLARLAEWGKAYKLTLSNRLDPGRKALILSGIARYFFAINKLHLRIRIPVLEQYTFTKTTTTTDEDWL